MIPYFGITETFIAAFIAWRWRSFPALVCVAALVATISIRFSGVEFLTYASAVWSLAGILLILMGYNLIGALYGLSGIVYLLGYAGLEDTRFAVIHILSDVSFLAGLVVCVWPRGGLSVGRNIRRFVHSLGSVKMAKYPARREKQNEIN